jgi:tight adherence protein B
MDLNSDAVIIGAAVLSLVFMLLGVAMLFNDMRSPDAVVGRRLRSGTGPSRQQRAALQLLRERQSDGVFANLGAKMPSLKEAIRGSGTGITTSQLLMVMALLTLLCFVLLTSLAGAGMANAALGSMLIGLGIPWYTLKFMAKRRTRIFLTQLPSALDLMVRSLEAGHPVLVAMGLVADEMKEPIRSEFGTLVNEISYGLSNELAFQHLLERMPVAEVRFLVAALEIQRQAGGNLGEVLGNLADVLRQRFALHKKIKSLTAEGRISGIIVGIIPFAIAGIILMINPSYYTAAMSHPLFNVAMGLGFFWLFVGGFLISRMVKVKV